MVARYRAKLSGPLLDRFDLVVEVPPLDTAALAGSSPGEPSARVRDRVTAARAVQRQRFAPDGAACNARMNPGELKRHAELDAEGRRLLLAAVDRLGLSARGYERVRRVARTLADLDGAAEIRPAHVAEGLQYRHHGWERSLGIGGQGG
jgi:magnesium chelatase family protein